jgi:hypothetical protein
VTLPLSHILQKVRLGLHLIDIHQRGAAFIIRDNGPLLRSLADQRDKKMTQDLAAIPF